MAEATDRPQVPPNVGTSEESSILSALAPAETYQALSLLALAGFGLAVVYALLVLIGGAVALVGHVPWLMPYWTFLLPVAVLIICWAARTRILNSEGTLSGLAFTLWGSRLAILFGITYAAYYLATFLAVRSPAIEHANDFFQKIKEGQLEQAFLKSQEMPLKGLNPNELRNMLEARFNQPAGMQGQSGYFSRFCQERFVRFIQMDGDKAIVTPIGVASWEYSKDGYRVVLIYHIATTLAEFDMKVEMFGRDPKPGDRKGRQWLVLLMRGETSILAGSEKLTPQGEQFRKKIEKAQSFVLDWAAKINDVASLEPAERESYSKLIRLDDKTFWAGEQQREEIIRRIRNTFRQSSSGKWPPFSLNLQPAALPLLREGNGRTTVWFDVTLRYFEEGTMMTQYIVNGRLAVSADRSAAADSSSAWRVDALELDSGRTSPEKARQQQMQQMQQQKLTTPNSL